MSALDHQPRYRAFMPPDAVNDDTVPVRRAPSSPDVAATPVTPPAQAPLEQSSTAGVGHPSAASAHEPDDDTIMRSRLHNVRTVPGTPTDEPPHQPPPPSGMPHFTIPAQNERTNAPTQDLPTVTSQQTSDAQKSSTQQSVKTPWAKAVIALMVLALIAAGILYARAAFFSPSATVDRYLGALVDGDAPRALQLSSSTASQADTYASQALRNYRHLAGRPTSFTINSVDEGESTAAVRATITQQDQTHDVVFTLRKEAGGFGLFSTWLLDKGLERKLDVIMTSPRSSGPARAAVINGGEAQATSGSTVSQLVLPGIYAVEGPARGRYFNYGPTQTVTAGVSDQYNTITLTEQPTQALEEDARALAEEIIASCLKDLNGKACPNQAKDMLAPADQIESFTWTPTSEEFTLDATSSKLTYSGKFRLWYSYPQVVTQYNPRIYAWETVTRFESETQKTSGKMSWLISIDPARESLSLAKWN
ncbi:hypothetical protein [Jonesia quinghaiensis]|uniref:hypothetical protein n=1 Tax=Jonesia quinghaiensis TaxID=262806 RepID=UPI00041D973D|nr:hypothetical protein [Jonesia quinghaiensis]